MVFKYFEAGNIDPEELLYYVKTNKIATIKKLLKNCNDLLYQETENGLTVLESICYHQFTEDLIHSTIASLLAKVDANKLKPNSQRGYKSLIHFAALGQNPIILEALIIKFPQQVKLKAERNTALHILIKESTSYGPNFLQCIEILLKNGVDIEAKDKLNKTAYDWATEKKLLDDSVLETFRPKTAPKKIPTPPKSESYRSRKSYAIPVNVDYRRSTPMSISPINQINSPMDYLRNLDENGFINYFKTNDSSDINEYLPYAIEHNLLNVVDYMIETNQLQPSENETHPLIIAKNHRHYDMLKLLLEKMEVPSDILFRLIRTADGCINESGFMECYQLIIESDKVDVNLADDYYNTALHCAGKYTRWGIMLLLLKNKASLANCNSDQQMAIVEIDTYVLGKHFDQCVQFGYQRLCEERLRLSFNYATLFPTRNQSKLDSCAESTPCIEDAIVEEDTAGVKLNFNENDQLFTQSNTMGASELEVILHLSNNPDKQSLLLHPLINALIDVIWHKVEIFVFINFIVYMLYCVSLGLHLGFGNNLSKAFLIIMCCVLILRECFQFSYQRASYFKQQNNYIEIAVCIVVALLLMTEKVQFKVVAALLSAFAYLSILDSMPTVASYVNMFQRLQNIVVKF
ncbi:transient receptor potential cation channel protein painless-like [Atheta coriaria]|uniref:transient receptor potential cation channel protein painless-like n=1 Tax=Dalotia coriaria TaxID=877792 RepID=UPI0031F363C3